MKNTNINFVLGNHVLHGLTDYVNFFSRELRECNFNVLLTNTVSPKMKNIIVENFNDEFVAIIKKTFNLRDDRLVMIATEVVRDGLLDSTSPDKDAIVTGWYDKNARHWQERTKYFFEVVPYFSKIVCVSEEIYKSLIDLNLGPKIIYWAPRYLGDFENFEKIWIKNNLNQAKLDHLIFTGGITHYRALQIETLKEKGIRLVCYSSDTPEPIRREVSKQAYFTLGPKHYKNTRQLSKMRALWCLTNGFPFLMERCEAATDLDKYCVFYESIEELISLINSANNTMAICKDNFCSFVIDSKEQKSSLLGFI